LHWWAQAADKQLPNQHSHNDVPNQPEPLRHVLQFIRHLYNAHYFIIDVKNGDGDGSDLPGEAVQNASGLVARLYGLGIRHW
jgi:hypothetical protein